MYKHSTPQSGRFLFHGCTVSWLHGFMAARFHGCTVSWLHAGSVSPFYGFPFLEKLPFFNHETMKQ
jgi:hypothetical protein